MTETREQFRTRVHEQRLDHLVGKIMLNADTVYASREFQQALHTGPLERAGADVHAEFLDRLLPRLEKLEWLPPELVPMMIRSYALPDTAEGIAGATGLRPDLHALLERHLDEVRLGHGDAPVVPESVDRAIWRNDVLLIVIGLIALATWVGLKVLGYKFF